MFSLIISQSPPPFYETFDYIQHILGKGEIPWLQEQVG